MTHPEHVAGATPSAGVAGLADAGPAALAVRDLAVSFAGVRALDGVTFSVPPGVTALIGPNGAGKTTLLNCVSGLYRYTGEILLGGRPLGRAPAQVRARRGIARTFQTPALLEELDAVSNVILGLPGGRSGEAAARRDALDLLGLLGLDRPRQRDVPVAGLPHGDRRRVETARALIRTPEVLLLDEPAAGLADAEAHRLVTVAAGLARCCLLVEHNVPLVMAVAQHVVVLASGQVLAAGPPDGIRRDPRVVAAYLGDGVA